MSLQLPWLHPERCEALLQALSQRILVIDGAMGTMVQSYKLVEGDYRGERFAAAAFCEIGPYDAGPYDTGNTTRRMRRNDGLKRTRHLPPATGREPAWPILRQPRRQRARWRVGP